MSRSNEAFGKTIFVFILIFLLSFFAVILSMFFVFALMVVYGFLSVYVIIYLWLWSRDLEDELTGLKGSLAKSGVIMVERKPVETIKTGKKGTEPEEAIKKEIKPVVKPRGKRGTKRV
ncbi:MAG: hypothetical protein ACXAEU_19595 [Candidatus Hodarchaeales archaeon]|jgi:hypothetical protein